MFRFVVPCSLLLLLPLAPLAGQEAPRVIVEGSAPEESLTAPSAFEARRQLDLVPGGTNLIDLQDVRRGRTASLKDALDFTPGVFIQQRYGAEESRLSIRGSGLQRTFHGRGVTLLLDGVPINLADGGFDFQAIEPLATKYIEVWRGPNAMRYGATSLGGAINYVMPTGRDVPPASIRFEIGSYGYLRAQAASGFASGPFDAYVSLSHFSQDGYRDHSEQDNQRLFLNLGWRWNANFESRLYFTIAKTYSNLPGSLTPAQLAANPRQSAPGNLVLDQERNYPLVRTALKNTWQSGARTLELNVYHSYKDLDHPIFQVIDQLSNDFGGELRYTDRSELFGRKNLFTAGVNVQYGRIENARFINLGNGGARGALTANDTQISRNLVAYVENQFYLLPKLALSTGLQYARSERELQDRFLSDRDQSDRFTYSAWNPKVGLLWEVTPRTKVYANFSRSFEPASFGELTAPPANIFGPVAGLLPLRAQRGTGFELGARGEEGAFRFDVTFYYYALRNELLSFDVSPNNAGQFLTINADRTTHAGVEAGLDVRLLELFGLARPLKTVRDGKETRTETGAPAHSLTLRQVYNWGRFRFDGDRVFGNNQLAGFPEHTYRAELLYEHRCGFYVGPNVEAANRSPVDFQNRLFASGYTLLNAKVGYRAKRWSVFVEGRNLTDARYVATTGVINRVTPGNQAVFLPGDGRAVYAGLEVKW